MKYRQLGRTDMRVSTVSFGAWPIGGGEWGLVDDKQSYAALNRAVDLGLNFIDTADVYGDGRSERLIGKLLKERKEEIFVATKAGKRLKPFTGDGFTLKNLERFVDQSLSNLGVASIDLLQLHCPPTQVFSQPETFKALDELRKKGKILHYGVSVEKISEALKASEYPNVETVQLIFNMLRLKPITEFFPSAKKANIGILARVPLASGLLTGKITLQTQFQKADHRSFNRNGEVFDKGETFSGVNLNRGLDAVAELRKLVPPGLSMTQFALRWILMFEAITCAIPGAKSPEQVDENLKAADAPALDDETMNGVEAIYNKLIRPEVHANW